jgi:hypothetical protein
MRTHAFTLVLSYIYGLVALLDNIQSSFSISTDGILGSACQNIFFLLCITPFLGDFSMG